VASKLLPRKYGERIAAEMTGANGGPIKTEQQFPELKDMSDEDLLALRDILMRYVGPEGEDGGRTCPSEAGATGVQERPWHQRARWREGTASCPPLSRTA
jgi:hypothetical protein